VVSSNDSLQGKRPAIFSVTGGVLALFTASMVEKMILIRHLHFALPAAPTRACLLD
jgi:hypothetical protein